MEIILGILVAVLAGYSVYLKSEHMTKDEKIDSLSGQVSSLLSSLAQIEVESSVISGVLSSLLEVSSKTAINKANKKLSDFVVELNGDGESVLKLTADIVKDEEGEHTINVTEVVDED